MRVKMNVEHHLGAAFSILGGTPGLELAAVVLLFDVLL
jgi:hypothetical protein